MNSTRMNKQKGFTLIETMVALTIFSLAILTPLMIAYRAAVLGAYARDEFIATFLAQDGIEFLRRQIMSNALDGDEGVDQVKGPINLCYDSAFVGQNCIVDTRIGIATANLCVGAGNTCPNVRFNEVTGEYGYDGTFIETQFNREVSIKATAGEGPGKDITAVTEFQIESRVFFGKPGDRGSIVIKELITDWRRD